MKTTIYMQPRFDPTERDQRKYIKGDVHYATYSQCLTNFFFQIVENYEKDGIHSTTDWDLTLIQN